LTTDRRHSPNTRLLRKESRVRFPHSTDISVHAHVCLHWVWVFSMYSMYVFRKKKKYISMYIYPLFRIHNTSLVNAYFGLDKRECYCLEYLFICYQLDDRFGSVVVSLFARGRGFDSCRVQILVCRNISVCSTYIHTYILLPTLFPHQVGSVQHVFHHVVIKIRQFTATYIPIYYSYIFPKG
jgi:hypothetical protein